MGSNSACWLIPLLIASLGLPQAGSAQSAQESHIWQYRATFQPLSRTAVAITGPISLSGNTEFAVAGRKADRPRGGRRRICLGGPARPSCETLHRCRWRS